MLIIILNLIDRFDMKINDWRLERGLSYSELARKVGASHATVARRWCLEESDPQHMKPATKFIRALTLASDGQVTANDIYRQEA